MKEQSVELTILKTIIQFTVTYFSLVALITLLIIANVGCKDNNDDAVVVEQPDTPNQEIVDKPGDCVDHPLKGTWTAVVEGVNDTFIFNEDCSYTRTFSGEEGYIDKAKDHIVNAPNAITNRGETFLDQHFFASKGSTVAENGWEQLEAAERGRPINFGLQPHRIGTLNYYDGATSNLLNNYTFRLNVKSWGMPSATAYMVYVYTKIN